jgi:hypothetical protein
VRRHENTLVPEGERVDAGLLGVFQRAFGKSADLSSQQLCFASSPDSWA